MCGIFAVHGVEKPSSERSHYIACSKKIRHRGPDWSGCFVGKQSVLVHERLAVVGVGRFCPVFDRLHLLTMLLDTGAQPLISQDGKTILCVNGEIYNHIALRQMVGPGVTFKTHSDCEVIIPLVCLHIILLAIHLTYLPSVQEI
jgi:asparagine synthase (glutamine-hydrolysing)